MKSFKSAFKLGVFATITVAATGYYFLKKNNETAGALLDRSINSLEKAANQANVALKDAQMFAQNKARNAFKNVNYHVENLKDDVKETIEGVDKGIDELAQDAKKNVEKGI